MSGDGRCRPASGLGIMRLTAAVVSPGVGAAEEEGQPMRAEQMAEGVASIGLGDDLLTAAEAITGGESAGVVVVDPAGRPCGLLPACEVVAATVPVFVRLSPCLAGCYDEQSADVALRRMLRRPIREVLGERQYPVLDGDATALELATAMAQTRSPLVVVGLGERGWGVVTAPRLLVCLQQGDGAEDTSATA
jgi:hypothetical protein